MEPCTGFREEPSFYSDWMEHMEALIGQWICQFMYSLPLGSASLGSEPGNIWLFFPFCSVAGAGLQGKPRLCSGMGNAVHDEGQARAGWGVPRSQAWAGGWGWGSDSWSSRYSWESQKSQELSQGSWGIYLSDMIFNYVTILYWQYISLVKSKF